MAASVDSAAETGIPTRTLAVWVAALVVALTVLRLWLASHLQLVEDEAYYWLWARDLDWGYYDHPPMVAWWIAAGRALFGDTEFAVRVVGVLSLLPASYLVYRIHVLLFANPRRALISVIWLHATLFVAVGGVVISPDTPIILFWTVALFGLAQVLRSQDGRWWYLVGTAAGCALLSKYTGLFLGLGIVLWLAAVPELRRWYARYELYLGGAIAMAIFLPNLIWNAGHGWPSFAHQFGRLARDEWAVRFIGDFFGGQLGMFTPSIFLFVAFGLGVAAWRAFRRRTPEWSLVAAMTVPLTLILLEYGLHDRVQANWTAIIVPIAVIAGVEVSYEEWYSGFWRSFHESTLRIAAPLGYFVVGFVYAQAVFDLVPDREIADPTSRMKGWQGLASEVELVAGLENAGFIATTNYGLNALLVFYGDPSRPVVQLTERPRYQNLTTPGDDLYSGTGIYVVRTQKDRRKVLRKVFEEVVPIATLERRRPGGVIELIEVYRLTGPKKIPPFVDAWA